MSPAMLAAIGGTIAESNRTLHVPALNPRAPRPYRVPGALSFADVAYASFGRQSLAAMFDDCVTFDVAARWISGR